MSSRNSWLEPVIQMVRECRHPDAQWLASLFPAGVEVTSKRMREVMLEQGDDPRALYVAWKVGPKGGDGDVL
jgi:hypothetical protein